MSPQEVYGYYIAIKLHFTSEKYDAVKYNYKVKQNLNLEKRKDKIYFIKLAKHNDPKGFVLANLSVEPNLWVGNLFTEKTRTRYSNWLDYQTNFFDRFSQELEKLKPSDFKLVDNTHPNALKSYIRNEISLDTLAIVDSLVHFSQKWDAALRDDPLWDQYRMGLRKYQAFLQFDQGKATGIIKSWLNK